MVSERRNKLIADLFHRIHVIEKWGRGIRPILSKEPDTQFEEVGTHFIVTFRRKGSVESGEKTVEETVEKTGEKIQKLIRQNLHITQRELMKKTGLSRRGIE